MKKLLVESGMLFALVILFGWNCVLQKHLQLLSSQFEQHQALFEEQTENMIDVMKNINYIKKVIGYDKFSE